MDLIFKALCEIADNFEGYANRPLRSDIDYCSNVPATCMIPGCRVHG